MPSALRMKSPLAAPPPALAVPQPTPVPTAPPATLPAHLQPLPPGPVRVIPVAPEGRPEWAIVGKQSYRFDHARIPSPSPKPAVLVEKAVPYEPLEPGAPAPYRLLPEVIGFKTGTDVVVQADAVARKPTPAMIVEVRVGSTHVHRLQVTGRRVCETVRGRIAFSGAQPFETLPLRYDYAYGGDDRPFQAKVLRDAEQRTDPEKWRRARPAFEGVFASNHPLMYPRNRYGRGYVIEDDPALWEGRELPRIEWPDDRLQPARLAVGSPMLWTRQPLPAGVDFVDPSMFPRSAMLGMPPPGMDKDPVVEEVERNLIPADYCRGNIFTAAPADLPRLIHPWGSRCASLGLCLPFLRGDEAITLVGMDAAHPEFQVLLPRRRAGFRIRSQPSAGELAAELHLVHIELRTRTLNMVWVGRIPREDTLQPADPRDMIADIQFATQGL